MTTKIHLIHFMIICASVLIGYWPALFGELVFDDLPAIVNNHDVHTNSILHLFKNDYWGTALNSASSHKSYRPLTIFTFRLNYMIHGLKPFGYHLVNLILHFINCLLIYKLCLRFIPKSSSALISSLLFSLHPVHTDAVASVVGRAELCSNTFFILGLLQIIKSNNKKSSSFKSNITISSSRKHLLYCILCSTIGFLFKEQCIMLLILICGLYCVQQAFLIHLNQFNYIKQSNTKIMNLIYQLNSKLWLLISIFISSILSFKFISSSSFSLNKLEKNNNFMQNKKKFTSQIAISFITFILIFYLRIQLHGNKIKVQYGHLDNFDFILSKQNLLIKCINYAFLSASHLWMLFYPNQLSCDWSSGSIEPIYQILDARNLFTIFILTSICILPFCIGLLNMFISYNVLILWMITFIPFIPASNIFINTGFVLAERVLYLPSVGFILFITLGLTRYVFLCSKNYRLMYLLLICLLFMTFKTNLRSSQWKTESSLFKSVLELHPNNVKIITNMAIINENKNLNELAVQLYKQAIRLNSDYLRAYLRLANLYIKNKQFNLAHQIYNKARIILKHQLNTRTQISKESMLILIQLAQSDILTKSSSNINNDIIYLYNKLENLLDYFYSDNLYNLAVILKNQNYFDKALNILKYIVHKYDHKPSLVLYIELISSQKSILHYQDVLEAAQKSLQLNGFLSAKIHFKLAMILLDQNQKHDQSLIQFHFKKSLELDPYLIQAHYNLAILYYKQNSLFKSKLHLINLLNLQPDHLKGNLFYCDLEIEIDYNLKNAFECYAKIMNKYLNYKNAKLLQTLEHNLCTILIALNQIKSNLTFCLENKHYFTIFNYFNHHSYKINQFQNLTNLPNLNTNFTLILN